jgi:hypothetical protein
VVREIAPAGIVAEFGAHPAVPVELMAVGVTLGVADGVLELVEIGGAPVAVGVGDGMRKHPLSRSALLLAITANSAIGTSRCDMSQS